MPPASRTLHPVPRLFVSIQTIRGLSAFCVVFEHSMFYASERLDRAIPVWDFGRIGVFLFFAISGFVMVVTNPPDVGWQPGAWRRFAIRRLIRVVPPYWLVLTIKVAALVVVPTVVLHAELTPGTTIASYFFIPTHNIDGKVQPLLGVGWTLTLEMAFYLVFTITLLLRVNATLWLTAILSVLALGYIVRPAEFPAWGFYFDPIVLFFAVGMLMGDWYRNRRTAIAVLGLSWVSLLWVVAYALHRPGGAAPDNWRALVDIATTVGFCVVVVLEPVFAARSPRIIRRMGDFSYSLYLTHPLVAPLAPAIIAWLVAHAVLPDVGVGTLAALSVGGSMTLALTVGYLAYRWFEVPVTRRPMHAFDRREAGRRPLPPAPSSGSARG